MANTFIPIASTELTSSATYIQFSSIPQIYDDLYCVASTRSDSTTTSESIIFRINNVDTGTSLIGFEVGASTTGTSNTYVNNGSSPGSTSTSNIFGVADIYIVKYAQTSKYIVFSTDAVNANNSTTFPATAIRSTAGLNTGGVAVTSLRIAPSTNNWVQYSRCDLYGIKNS